MFPPSRFIITFLATVWMACLFSKIVKEYTEGAVFVKWCQVSSLRDTLASFVTLKVDS